MECEGNVRSLEGKTLRGKTVGIIGLGGTGRAVTKRLRPFRMRLIGIKCNPEQRIKEELGLEWMESPYELKEPLNRSLYVVLCVPVTEEGTNLMNRERFS